VFICNVSPYRYPWHSYQTSLNLDLYLSINKRKLKNVNIEYQTKVGYWASFNHLQDYKIYGTVIKIFLPKFLNGLRQPLKNNPWPTHPMNKNFRTQFHQHCDYLFGF
jgi:hypothetical protein